MMLTSDQRAWMTKMADQWGARAEALRHEPGRSAAVRASAVQDIVDDYRRRLATAGTPVRADEIVRLTKLLAGAQPHPGPRGLTINGGAIMDAVRHQLAARLAALRGEASPVPPPRLVPVPPITPTAEPAPFTAGPQLDLFACGEAA